MEQDKDIEEGAQPPGISKDDIVFNSENPYRARAVPRGEGQTVIERARTRAPRSRGTYPDLVEGSDSARTGTNWGVLAVEDAAGDDKPRANTSEA